MNSTENRSPFNESVSCVTRSSMNHEWPSSPLKQLRTMGKNRLKSYMQVPNRTVVIFTSKCT